VLSPQRGGWTPSLSWENKGKRETGDRGFFTHPVVTLVANLSYMYILWRYTRMKSVYVYSVEIYKEEDCIIENLYGNIECNRDSPSKSFSRDEELRSAPPFEGYLWT
jgi:hypothetical protein